MQNNDDPYAKAAQLANPVESVAKETARARKWRILKSKLGNTKSNFINGFISGAAIGGMFGFAVGLYSMFQTRRLVTIPLSMLASGCSFGMIVACGSIIRN